MDPASQDEKQRHLAIAWAMDGTGHDPCPGRWTGNNLNFLEGCIRSRPEIPLTVHGFGPPRPGWAPVLSATISSIRPDARVTASADAQASRLLPALPATFPALHIPSHVMTRESRLRSLTGSARYSLIGLCEENITTDDLWWLAVAPVFAWDVLVFHSGTAKYAAIKAMEHVMAFSSWLSGGTRSTPLPQLCLLPPAIHADGCLIPEGKREEIRQTLDIPDEAIVALRPLPGHTSGLAAMPPLLAAMERAASAHGKPLFLLDYEPGSGSGRTTAFEKLVQELAPSCRYRTLFRTEIGNHPVTAMAAADFVVAPDCDFTEAAALPVLAAMGAGLPVICAGWGPNRETVRHGVDGFRIPALAPAGGHDRMLNAHVYAADIEPRPLREYQANMVSLDIEALCSAIVALAGSRELRLQMGTSGQARIRENHDTPVAMARHQELLDELARRRQHAIQAGRPGHASLAPKSFRPDMLEQFSAHPGYLLSDDVAIFRAEEIDEEALRRIHALLRFGQPRFLFPSLEEILALRNRLEPETPLRVRELAGDGKPEKHLHFVQALCFLLRVGAARAVPTIANEIRSNG